jgi:hypothetical protein
VPAVIEHRFRAVISCEAAKRRSEARGEVSRILIAHDHDRAQEGGDADPGLMRRVTRMPWQLTRVAS